LEKHHLTKVDSKLALAPQHTVVICLSVMLMLISASLWVTTSTSTYAAIATKPTTANTPTVKIISPLKGQQVFNGHNLIVSGISSSMDHNGKCAIYVIVNGIKPYQRAAAIGHGGSNDYSSWKYTITPKYASIKNGLNKITAKISCLASPTNLTKFYSVNVTGVGVIHGANGQNGKNGANGSAISSNGGIAIGGNGGRGGNGGSANGGNGGLAIGGKGGNGGNGGSANGGNGGLAIGGKGGNGGSGGNGAIGGNG
jgi:hypothetical protein